MDGWHDGWQIFLIQKKKSPKISILKKWKKNNTGIGPVKWNCLVHTNKIVPKKKRKGKKNGYENISKIFLHPKKKDISTNSEIFSVQFNWVKKIN
jgi:hypothetical protein